jgi:hypothetical protein
LFQIITERVSIERPSYAVKKHVEGGLMLHMKFI